MKQVLRSKHRIRLLDYELNNLHKLKLRLAKDWKSIASKADMDVKYVFVQIVYCQLLNLNVYY